jgi:hypothetical protein
VSAEMDVLDVLLGTDEDLLHIRQWCFESDEHFARGILGLVTTGDVRLLGPGNEEVPRWKWRELFVDGTVFDRLPIFRLRITEQGVKRVEGPRE